jgi:hypothetical protein
MNNLPLHLLQEITDFCDIKCILSIVCCNKLFTKLYIKDLSGYEDDLEDSFKLCRITDEILLQNKYKKLSKLNLHGGNLTNFDHLLKLKELTVCNINYHHNNINNECLINCSSLTYLNLFNHSRVSDINSLINLKILIASGPMCGIDNDGIKKCLNLVKLDMRENKKITELNHLIDLEELSIDDHNKYTYSKLPKIKLSYLSFKNCKKLKCLHVKNFDEYIPFNDIINLEELSIVKSFLKIIDIQNCEKLKRLSIIMNINLLFNSFLDLLNFKFNLLIINSKTADYNNQLLLFTNSDDKIFDFKNELLNKKCIIKSNDKIFYYKNDLLDEKIYQMCNFDWIGSSQTYISKPKIHVYEFINDKYDEYSLDYHR